MLFSLFVDPFTLSSLVKVVQVVSSGLGWSQLFELDGLFLIGC